MSNRRTSVALSGLLAATASWAGSVLEFQTTEFGGGEPIVGTVQISTSGNATRLEIISVSSLEAGGMIYRVDSKEMIILDHAQGQYMVIDRQQLTGASLADEPPQRRSYTINDLNSHGEVAGVACRNYEVVSRGRKIRELCMSDWDDIHGGQETANAIKGIADFFAGMRQAHSATGGMDVFDRQQELFGHMQELDGYPVLYRDFSASGSLERQTLLTGAREEAIAAGFFDPPAGYRLQELPQGMN